ncbi:protein unc-80 homolog isoform X7 [Nilaparvata lugens]|uniref:protein unc-80 homolog isoform X7 n=1 Tax=Nilaparvata lugens TaxID=108931 RepID=UPI00193CAB31|nr:protein unc-80 homolog isoform X7 [Nilaparvata lugens]
MEEAIFMQILNDEKMEREKEKERRESIDSDSELSLEALPIPIQVFFWQQISPFIRPKLGKHHEASCMELKEACKSFEKILVQNIQFGLSPNLTTAIQSIPRWRLIQASFPYVMHSIATLLHSRKDTSIQSLGTAETKLLYILHWIILDAAEECADADFEKGTYQNSPYYYLFTIPDMTLFIYLFAPLCHHIKEPDLQAFRLENGLKIWQALWEYRHPDSLCFTAHCKPKPRSFCTNLLKTNQQTNNTDFFIPGRKPCATEETGGVYAESPPSQTTTFSFGDQQSASAASTMTTAQPPATKQDEDGAWVSSPKDTVFPETIPEESSSTEEEHVVIFRLPSLADSDGLKEQIYTFCVQADTSMFQVTVGKPPVRGPTRATLSIDTQHTQHSALDSASTRSHLPPMHGLIGWSMDKESLGSTRAAMISSNVVDIAAATFMDVAVLRCLFIPSWQEEGIYWALQFLYHRLHNINEDSILQQQPRRRCNSLPTPKIEVSFHQSPESKKKQSKAYIEVPEPRHINILAEAPYCVTKKAEEALKRRSSEKVKKKMKMADLRAFVETKLLSKSEKGLNRIGRDETKSLSGQEYHRSLDTGDVHLAQAGSALSKLLEPTSSKIRPATNLVKGKSMPSLSCLLDELTNGMGTHYLSRRYIGETRREQTDVSPNPIITVTEHTPIPSPDFAHHKGSLESQMGLGTSNSGQSQKAKKPGLTRSQTDSNISYPDGDNPEVPGSTFYITNEGDIDLQVVLKAIHSVAQRDNMSCTLRVCEVLLNVADLLVEMGILKQYANRNEMKKKTLEEIMISPHALLISCIVRVIRHLGCPHCMANDGQRNPPPDFLRSQGQTILGKLQRANSSYFSKVMRQIVSQQTITELMEFFHAYLGFCIDPSTLLSPLNQKRSSSKSPDIISQGGYSTNFGGGGYGSGFGSRNVEGHLMTSIFKTLVSRLVKISKDLKTPENQGLYCDVRSLMTYVKEAHGGVFRRVALSGLLDTAMRPHRKEPAVQTTRVIRHFPHTEQDDHMEPGSYILDDRDSRKILFKKRSTSSTCASLLETELEEGKVIQSPLTNFKKKHPVLTPRQSERNLGAVFGAMQPPHKPIATSKFQIVNWFRKEYGRSDSLESHDGSDSPVEGGALIHQAAQLHQSYSRTSQKSTGSVGNTLQKARRRVEDQINKLGFGRGKKKDGSIEDTQGSYFSRRNSLEMGDHGRESEFVVLKERKLVDTQKVWNGMCRLSFLLEVCSPGSIPDPYLLAASLDLPHTPVVARACFIMECTYLVHCCNKGQWAAWVKPSTFPMFRPSGPLPPRGVPPVPPRKTHSLQRAAGKMFYQWGEALAGRLEEMLLEDKTHVASVIAMLSDESKQRELIMEDEEEDFLDESTVNLYGSECPIALRLLACMLLLEITSFLRETYQTLPKSCRTSARDRPAPWERIYSRDANRRWSMALSSMGHSQTSAQSLQSITGDRDPDLMSVRSLQMPCRFLQLPGEREQRLRTNSVLLPPSTSISPRPSMSGLPSERKISFVLHEPDNESEGSSNTTVTMQGEEGQGGAVTAITGGEDGSGKKGGRGGGRPVAVGAAAQGAAQGGGRPFLLRRGTTAANATGSFKRRSLKLRRGTKDGQKALDGTAEAAADFKRVDSIQSKRKVSSISDRSDNSEQGGPGEVSGEESPGILSDDQPPESPSDSNDTDDTSSHLPWLKVMVQVMNSFNFYCSHQTFCHPFCYRRHMRAASRLIKAVRKVYGEEFGLPNFEEKSQPEDPKKDTKFRSRKVSEQASTQASPVKRKDSVSKKDKIDNSQIGSKLGHKDSSKDVTEADTDKGQNQNPSSTKKKEKEKKDPPPILKYIKTQVRDCFHAPIATLVKGAVVLGEDQFVDSLAVAWELLLEHNQEVAAGAAALFIVGAVRAPAQATDIMQHALHHQEPAHRINAILRFQVLWKQRYQVWARMEEGAQVTFKVPPPGIEFTLPSPKIGIESLPVVDPPWMPQVKTKVEEVTISQESHRSLVTATKTRKKQQTELIKLALQQREDKKRTERENFLVTTIPITVQAAYEPSLHHATAGDDHEEVAAGDEEQVEPPQRNASHHIHSAHSLFPSCLCSAVIQIINLLDDAAVSPDGCAVYEVAYKVIWTCLVEDSALFLRYVLERLTREKQDIMFKILRHLIRFVPRLPQQAAFTLYNYIIGYVMFYVRSPQEGSQQLIGSALSILWMVVHSVHGIMFKDLKQILRKEQCDASILLTANVPSTKKIIVHGPQDQDDGGIPSQFPVQEDTQFLQILRESLDFFTIDESQHKEFFLVDHKTHQIHNPNSYVRDYYFFKRSQYPQLQLVHMKPDEAFNALQRQELMHKFVEIGKVLLTWAILKNVDMVVQRVVFLHEELMKLPSFPRKALEADLDLYKGGEMGKELLGLDVLHKFMWVRLIARMFEAMAGNFAYSGDIHLFLNVLNGAVILHSEDACILRYVMATYINAAHNFKNIFSTNGYLLIIPTLLQLYASHQTNKLVTRTVEYVVKQLYLMNRKPFILQMFGSVSAILDIDDTAQLGDAHKVPSSCLFRLLMSLETPSPDPLNIGELVKEEKPLQAIDFCYHDESEMVGVLDCISLCVMVVAYAADSVRGHQMLIILEAIVPCYLQQIQLPSYRKQLQEGRSERDIIAQLAVAIKTLVNNCEALSKNYNGPQKASPEHKGSSQRNYNREPFSPGLDFEDESHSKFLSERSRTKIHYERDMEDSEVLRNEFRRPRDILLSLVADFMTKTTARLIELNKKFPQDSRQIELLDLRAHIRLADVAHSLLKVSAYDPDTMSCKGLQRYMTQLLPATDWSNEALRPSLITILRRLDKTFSKISKKPSIRRHTDWDAASGLIRGVYETLSRYPYIVHMQHLKTLVNTCQSLVIGEANSSTVTAGESLSSATNALMSQVPPPPFPSTVVRLIALQILAVGESYTLEHVCGGSSILPTQEKTESLLMNLLMPLCLRVGSGRKDIHCMREGDVRFTLNVVLHAMYPPTSKAAQSLKIGSELRTGSFSGARDSKANVVIPKSLYQVAFLALKVMLTCFEDELVSDWPKIGRTVRELSKVAEARPMFWNFIDFIVSQRCPLFVILQSFIRQKLSQPALTDQERHYHFVLREKLTGLSPSIPKCRGALLTELMQQMKTLKAELEFRSDEQASSKKPCNDADPPPMHQRHHRPSIIDLLRDGSSNLQSALQSAAGHRESVSSSPGPVGPTCSAGGSCSQHSSQHSIASYGQGKGTSAEALSATDDSAGEHGSKPNKPRLQRSKAQSRKTFRLRKSRIESHGHHTGHGVPKDSDKDKGESKSESSTPMVQSPTVVTPPTTVITAAAPIPTPQPPQQAGRGVTTRMHPPQLRTDTSWEDDSALSQTSSTSGYYHSDTKYRENCSLLMMALESPPDMHHMCSTSSSTVVPPPSGSTPPSSSPSPSPDPHHHSTLMVYEAQDEDTLI